MEFAVTIRRDGTGGRKAANGSATYRQNEVAEGRQRSVEFVDPAFELGHVAATAELGALCHAIADACTRG